MSLPSNLSYGKVSARYLLAIGDTSDPDVLPDSVPASGTLTFTPSASILLDASTTPPTTIVPQAIECTLNEDGDLVDPEGNVGVYLIATDDPDLQPVDFTWRVTALFDGLVKPITFDFELPSDSEVDLTLLTPMPSSSGTYYLTGPQGPANVLSIGTVTTGAAGSSAGATITGTSPTQTLTLTIPRGDKGDQGIQGVKGDQGIQGVKGDTGNTGATGATGPANSLSIGTITTGAAGSSASASVTGAAPAQTLSITIPRGDTGATGATGPAWGGAKGAWSAATAYIVNDLATYAGGTYRRKVAGTTATNPASDTTNWEVFAAKGTDGTGTMNGPAVSVSGNLPSFNGTAGTLLADSGIAAANLVLLTGAQTIGGAKTFTTNPVITQNGAANDANQNVLLSTTGTDATLGGLILQVYANPSATGANRYGAIAAGDSSAMRPLILNKQYNGAGYGPVGIGYTNPNVALGVLALAAGQNAILASGRSAVATVNNKALTSNVATLTTAAAHGFIVGRTVVVAGVDATFNGTYTVASIPTTTTFTYAKTAADVASVAATGTATGDVHTGNILSAARGGDGATVFRVGPTGTVTAESFNTNADAGYSATLLNNTLNFTRASANYINAGSAGGSIRITGTTATSGDTLLANFQVSQVYIPIQTNFGSSTSTVNVPSGGAAANFIPKIVAAETSGQAGVQAYVSDGTNNRRAALIVNQTDGVWGLTHTASSGLIPFVVTMGGTEALRLTTAGYLGLGTSAPIHTVTLGSTSTGITQYNTVDQTTNFERARAFWSGSQFFISTDNGGTGAARDLVLSAVGSSVKMLGTGVELRRDSTTVAQIARIASSGLTAASGSQVGLLVDPTINQSGTAGYSAIKVNVTETATGSGSKYLLHLQTGAVDRFVIDNAGTIITRPPSAGTNALSIDVAGDTASRFAISAGSGLSWGPGNAAVDTTLSRSAAGALKTSGTFTGTQVIADNGAGLNVTVQPNNVIFNRATLASYIDQVGIGGLTVLRLSYATAADTQALTLSASAVGVALATVTGTLNASVQVQENGSRVYSPNNKPTSTDVGLGNVVNVDHLSGGGREKVAALSATTGTATGDLSAASIFTITPTGTFTIAFSNVPATGTSCTATVIINQGTTAYAPTYPTGTVWIGSAAPTQVISKKCVVTLMTVDGGTSWMASAAVQQ